VFIARRGVGFICYCLGVFQGSQVNVSEVYTLIDPPTQNVHPYNLLRSYNL
jgi:hypothetical protein